MSTASDRDRAKRIKMERANGRGASLLLAAAALMLLPALLLAAGRGAQCAASAASRVSLAGDDWRPFHYAVYATAARGAEPLAPLETLSYLKRLRELYARPGAEEEGKSLRARAEKVDRLLAAADMSLSSCDSTDQFRELNELIAYNQPFQLNVVPYLQYHRNRLFALCGDSLYSQVQEALARLSAADRDTAIGADFFKQFESTLSKAGVDLDEKALVEDLLGLMETRTRVLEDEQAKEVGSLGRPAFDWHVRALAEELCGPYKRALERPLGQSGLLDIGLDLFRTGPLHKWLVYAAVCRRLTGAERGELVRAAHDQFFDRHCHGAIRG